MSPKLGAITQRMPRPSSAHTAPSRDEPQPKFAAGHQDAARRDRRLVQQERRVRAPPSAQEAPGLEAQRPPVRGDAPSARATRMITSVSTLRDAATARRPRVNCGRTAASRALRRQDVRMSVMRPAIAAAAAVAGLARCVRAPGPWRPTKLRFDVDTQRSPGRRPVRRSWPRTSSSPARATRSRQRGRPGRAPRPRASRLHLLRAGHDPGAHARRDPRARRRPPRPPADRSAGCWCTSR